MNEIALKMFSISKNTTLLKEYISTGKFDIEKFMKIQK